jgi:hypothetical protein
LSGKFYFGVGMFLVFALLIATLSSEDHNTTMLDRERDKAFERQRMRREGIERSAFGDDA